ARRGEDDRDVEGEVARLRARRFPRGAGAPVVPRHQHREGEQHRERGDLHAAGAGEVRGIVRRLVRLDGDDGAGVAHFATKPASVIRLLLRASSSSRNFTMSLPEYHTGFNACFSMYSLYSAVCVTFLKRST